MAYINFNNSKLLTKKATKHIVVVIIFCFINNFIVSPAFAAEQSVADVYILPAGAREREIIKSPESETRLNEILVAPEPETNITKTPDLIKKFKPLKPEDMVRAGKLIKDKPLSFTPAALPEGTKGFHVTMTAYNSEKAQTDNDPCHSADGTDLCARNIEDTVAANFLPMGTVIKVPELFGDRTFVVRDRTNPKYAHRVDFWMRSKKDALQFGRRQATIVVVS